MCVQKHHYHDSVEFKLGHFAFLLSQSQGQCTFCSIHLLFPILFNSVLFPLFFVVSLTPTLIFFLQIPSMMDTDISVHSFNNFIKSNISHKKPGTHQGIRSLLNVHSPHFMAKSLFSCCSNIYFINWYYLLIKHHDKKYNWSPIFFFHRPFYFNKFQTCRKVEIIVEWISVYLHIYILLWTFYFICFITRLHLSILPCIHQSIIILWCNKLQIPVYFISKVSACISLTSILYWFIILFFPSSGMYI